MFTFLKTFLLKKGLHNQRIPYTQKIFILLFQVFNSIGIAFGCLVAFSSYNPFHGPILKDTLIVVVVDAITCIICGFCVFSTMGNLALEQGTVDNFLLIKQTICVTLTGKKLYQKSKQSFELTMCMLRRFRSFKKGTLGVCRSTGCKDTNCQSWRYDKKFCPQPKSNHTIVAWVQFLDNGIILQL